MEQRALSFSFAAILVVWGFEWALWLGRAAQPGLMTPLVISPGLIQTRTGAGLVGRQLATGKKRWICWDGRNTHSCPFSSRDFGA